jgi:2-O-methyltransferase
MTVRSVHLAPMRRMKEWIGPRRLVGLRRAVMRCTSALRAVSRSPDNPDAFLARIRGLIHVGANIGQERDLYASLGVSVLWIEPISEVFDALQRNIAGLPRQRALHRLVSDQDGNEYDFHIANNSGMSSSILQLHLHRDIWPEIVFDATVRLRSVTLDALVDRGEIDPAEFQALVLDTQGSELLILRGASRLLGGLQFVKTEAADFEVYADCAKVDDLVAYLRPHGFALQHRVAFAQHPRGGACYDLVFSRTRSASLGIRTNDEMLLRSGSRDRVVEAE